MKRQAGQQRALETHTDGSIFSFNVALSDPAAFDGGGTWFEPLDVTVRPPRCAAIGHSGQLRHAGVEITRGERYILVGFVGTVAAPQSAWRDSPFWRRYLGQVPFDTVAEIARGAILEQRQR